MNLLLEAIPIPLPLPSLSPPLPPLLPLHPPPSFSLPPLSLSSQESFLIALRAPPGWSVDSPKMVVVDAVSCNAGNDLDFHIHGFGLSGHLPAAPGATKPPDGPLTGPAGILVTLQSAHGTSGSSGSSSSGSDSETQQQVAATAVTDASGVFSFPGLPVGAYELSASHPLWTIHPLVPSTLDSTRSNSAESATRGSASARVPVEVGCGSKDTGALFYVASYTLAAAAAQNQPDISLVTGSGRVEDGEGRGVEGATVMLDGLSVAVTDAQGDYSFRLPSSLLSSTLHHPSPAAAPIPPTPPTPPPPSPPLPRTHTVTAVRPLYAFPTLANITLPPAPAPATAATATATATAAPDATTTTTTTGASETEAASLTTIALPPIRATRYALCGRVEMDPGGESSFVPWRRVELSRAGDFDGSHMDGSQDPSWDTISTSARGISSGRSSSSRSGGGGSGGSKGLSRQEASGSVAPVIAEADKDGRFCFMVPRGSYQLVPEISPDEVAAGLVFSPSIEESVTVTSAPVTNIVFKQSHLFISGKVRCLQECDSTVTVTLWTLTDNGADERADEGADGETEQQQGTFLQRVVVVGGGEGGAGGKAEGRGNGKGRREGKGRGEGEGRSAAVVEKRGMVGSFFFDRLLPGSYRIEARKAPANATELQSVEWCWEEEGRADVAVFDSPVTNVQLAQRGWRMVVRAAMDDRFTLTHGEYDPTDFSVSPGVQEFCVESPGEYTLAMSHACAYYGALSFSFHTRQPKPILLTPTAYRVSGLVFLNTSLLLPSLSHLSLEATIVARISGNEDGGSDSYGTLSVRRPPSREDPVAIYDQSYWLEPHTSLVLSLHHSGFPSSPPTHSFIADGAATDGAREFEPGEVDLGEVDLGEVDLGEGWEQQVQEEQEGGEGNLEAGTLVTGSPQDTSENLNEWASPDGAFPFPPTPRLLFYPAAIPVRAIEVPYAPPANLCPPRRLRNCRALQVPSAPPASLCLPRHVSHSPTQSPQHPFKSIPTPCKSPYSLPLPLQVRVEPFRCPPPLPTVYARPGVFLTARITPALPGVNLSVVADSASDAGSWQEGKLVGWRLTEGWHGGEKGRRDLGESDGEERRVAGAGMEGEDNTEEVVLGPLYDDASYHLELNKVGYSGGALG
ncbi:unnamed protein product [Closterium sp. Naga37s-1]|nr:unnamed protein product [Closterium sp. Naga37s-1]